MSKIVYAILLPILFVVAIWVIVLTAMPRHGVIRYDCSIAEISPDFPPDVRNECRKKNSGRI
jgi:hypothetical protein